jgi:hypothetical protein
MEVVLADLKATLPNFPDEVLEDWLLPYAKTEGWPPFGPLGAPQGHRWPYLLGKKSLPYWLSLKWSPHETDIAVEALEPKSQESICQMILAAAKDEENLYSASIPDLKERFVSVLTHLNSTSRLPGAPTLLSTDGGYRVLDGNHRMAAYLFAQMLAADAGQPLMPQRFWIGAT